MHNPVGSRRFILCFFFPILIMNAVNSRGGRCPLVVGIMRICIQP